MAESVLGQRMFAILACLFLLGTLSFGGPTLAQGLPVFDGSQFDQLVIEKPTRTVARNRDRIKASGAKPVTRYTLPTLVRQAARGIGQVRVEVGTNGDSLTVICTGLQIAKELILTAHRCGPGLMQDPAVASFNPTKITRIEFITGYEAPRRDAGARARVEITPVEADAELGYTVLRMSASGTSDTVLPLTTKAPSSGGVPLVIVSHPYGESLHVLREGCATRSAASADGRLSHGCATLPGSAGAPVLDTKGRVIALHLENASGGRGGRAVTLARLVAHSQLLRAVSEGASCTGASMVLCGLAAPVTAVVPPGTARPLPDPEIAAPLSHPVARNVEITEPSAALDEAAKGDPTAPFPVGNLNGKPAVYGVALPYLPPGTGVELVTGPVGDLGARNALMVAGKRYAATLTRLSDRHAALSLWRLPEGTLVARRYVAPAAVAFAIDPNDQTLAVAVGTGPQIDVFSLPELNAAGVITPEGEGAVSALEYSPDGRRLAVAVTGAVSIWELEAQTRVAVVSKVEGPPTALRYSPDGRLLALGTPDGGSLYDAETGAHLRDMEKAPIEMSGLVFTPDGRQLIAGAAGVQGLRWDVETGANIGRVGGVDGGRMLGLDPSGHGVFLGENGLVEVYSIDESEPSKRFESQRIISAALAQDGASLIGHVSGNAPGLVFIDPKTGNLRAKLRQEVAAVTALAFSPDSTRLALGGTVRPETMGAERLQIWSWQDGQVTLDIQGDGFNGPTALAWHPLGASLVGQSSGALRSYDLNMDAARTLADVKFATGLAFLGGGALITHVKKNGSVMLVDTETGATRHSWPGQFAAVSLDGAELAIGGNTPSPSVSVVNAETGKPRLKLEMPFTQVGPMAWRGPEREIVGFVKTDDPSREWMLALWNADDGKVIRRFGQFSRSPRVMAVSHDGRFVAVAEVGAQHVLLWDMSVDRFLWRLETGGAEVRALAFAPDGLRIAAGLAPGAVVLWDMINGQVKARLAPFAEDTLAQVDATLFMSDPTMLDRVAVRLPNGTLLPAQHVLRDGLPEFVPEDLPLPEQVSDLLDRLRAGDKDARLLLVDGRAMAFEVEFRRELQRQLKAAGVYSGLIDGDIGRGSRRALELFATLE